MELYRFEKLNCLVGGQPAWHIYEYREEEAGPGAYVHIGIGVGKNKDEALEDLHQRLEE